MILRTIRSLIAVLISNPLKYCYKSVIRTSPLLLIWMLGVVYGMTSCFTGIEGTKKITLSKDDIKRTTPTKEEALLSSVIPTPLGCWEPGKRFYITDDKASFLFRPFQENVPHMGDTIRYSSVIESIDPDGTPSSIISFTLHDKTLRYHVRQSVQQTSEKFNSSRIPLIIDLDLVDSVAKLLMGRTVWTKTNIWYSKDGEHHKGKKYVPVIITDVTPGNNIFPLRLSFHETDKTDGEFFTMMNYSDSGFDSRSFDTLFSLEDLHTHYPHITNEHWELIKNGDIATGMTKEECRLSLGKSSDISSGHSHSTLMEIWKYPDGSYLNFADGLLVSFRH